MNFQVKKKSSSFMHALVIRYKSLHDCPYPMSPWMGSDHQPTLYLYYTPHTNTGFFLNLCLQFVQQLEKSISKLIIKVIVIIVTITISTRKKKGEKREPRNVSMLLFSLF